MDFTSMRLHAFIIVLVIIAGESCTLGSQTRSLRNVKWQTVNSQECGPVRLGNRITGGKIAPLGQYPWMARLGYEKDDTKIKFKCGGSLINPKYVLTAAHCVYSFEKKLVTIRLGERIANSTKDCEDDVCALPVQDIPIDKHLIHPGYNQDTVKNDISLLRLAGEAKYNEFVKPICLPHDSMKKTNYVSQTVEIAGWGVVDSDTQQVSNTLLFVTLPVRDRCACNELMPDLKIDGTQFCVGLETGEDSCTGDSGGPMMKMERVNGTKKYYLLGVVSVGKSYCGEAPAVYTNVVNYMDWILETMVATERNI